MTDFYFNIIINDSIIENKKRNGGRKIARKESGNIEQPLRFKMKIVIIKNRRNVENRN